MVRRPVRLVRMCAALALAFTSLGGPTTAQAAAGAVNVELFGSLVSQLGSTSFADVFAGIELKSSGGYTIFVHGNDAVFAARVAALGGAVGSYTFQAVPGSLSAMRATTSVLEQKEPLLKTEGIILNSWGPDPSQGLVRIQLTAPTQADFTSLDTLLGQAPGTTDGSNYIAAAQRFLAERFGPNLYVESSYAALNQLTDRRSDTPPFSGGDNIQGIYTGVGCTGGFPVVWGGSSPQYMLSAGHCGNDYWEVSGSQAFMGVTDQLRDQNGTDDFQLIGQDSPPNLAEVWGGPAWAPVQYTLAGTYLPPINSPIAWDGSVTREVRNIPMINAGQCAAFYENGSYFETVCSLIESPNSNPVVAQSGDSGGPVFQHTCETCNSVYPIATIIGSNSSDAWAQWLGQAESDGGGFYVPTSA